MAVQHDDDLDFLKLHCTGLFAFDRMSEMGEEVEYYDATLLCDLTPDEDGVTYVRGTYLPLLCYTSGRFLCYDASGASFSLPLRIQQQ